MASWTDVCACCSRCKGPVVFLEGPICDRCLDRDEECPPWGDKYQAVRERDAREANRERDAREANGERGTTSQPLKRGANDNARGVGRLLVDLVAKNVIYLRR